MRNKVVQEIIEECPEMKEFFDELIANGDLDEDGFVIKKGLCDDETPFSEMSDDEKARYIKQFNEDKKKDPFGQLLHPDCLNPEAFRIMRV